MLNPPCALESPHMAAGEQIPLLRAFHARRGDEPLRVAHRGQHEPRWHSLE
jgi:hypothetical protein